MFLLHPIKLLDQEKLLFHLPQIVIFFLVINIYTWTESLTGLGLLVSKSAFFFHPIKLCQECFFISPKYTSFSPCHKYFLRIFSLYVPNRKSFFLSQKKSCFFLHLVLSGPHIQWQDQKFQNQPPAIDSIALVSASAAETRDLVQHASAMAAQIKNNVCTAVCVFNLLAMLVMDASVCK